MHAGQEVDSIYLIKDEIDVRLLHGKVIVVKVSVAELLLPAQVTVVSKGRAPTVSEVEIAEQEYAWLLAYAQTKLDAEQVDKQCTERVKNLLK